ncbi:MAG: DUF2752 domain-containing protein [bacterium]|nr:DUF2752 domain-containing protein [bacterium]
MKEKKIQWVSLLAAAALIVLGLWLLLEFYPTYRDFFPKCVLYELTGLYCPGCGTTRAVRSLLCGDFYKALRYNPLLTLSLPFLLWWAYREFLWAMYQKPRPPWLLSLKFALAVVLIVTIYFIGRNLPWPPFCSWAPLPD